MASHNTKPDFVFHNTPPANTTRKDNAASHRTPSSKASESDTTDLHSLTLKEDDLSIEDDFGNGGDPYNSTGQHVVLKQRKST